jgi:hypothetical protein
MAIPRLPAAAQVRAGCSFLYTQPHIAARATAYPYHYPIAVASAGSWQITEELRQSAPDSYSSSTFE